MRKHHPSFHAQPPDGVVQVDGEWRYTEWAEGGFIRARGLEEQPISPELAVPPTSVPIAVEAPVAGAP